MKKLLSMFLVLAMLFALTGTALADDTPANGVVRTYFWEQPGEDTLAAIAYTEEKYQIKLDWELVSWDSLNSRYIADITSGDAPDIMLLQSTAFPRVAIQKLVMPVSSLNQELLANLAAVDPNGDSARKHFSFAGEGYAITGSNGPRVIFFNQTMFEDFGLDTPLELFEAGEWNWDTFRQSAIDVMDYNEDGTVRVWGFETWVYDMWYLANGAQVITPNDDGTVKLNLDDPKLVRALQFMQDGYYKDKFINPSGNGTMTADFVSGKCAMIADGFYRVYEINDVLTDEWDFVPVPEGPDNTEGVIPGNIDAYGVPINAKNPDGALLYFTGMCEYGEAHQSRDLGYASFMDDDQYERYYGYITGEKAGSMAMNTMEGYGNIANKQWDWWSQIFNGTPVATANEAFAQVFQAEIDATLADLTPAVREDFVALPVIDFETEENAALIRGTTIDGGGWGNSSFSVVEDGIAGKSLQILRDNGSEWQLAACTVAESFRMPAYDHIYTITFDYKMLSDIGEGGYFYVCLRPEAEVANGGVNYGWATQGNLKAGDTGTFSCTISCDRSGDPLCVVIGGYLNGDILIDNITVTE